MIISFKNNFSFTFNNIKKESLKINPDLLSKINNTKYLDDSVNLNQNWNNTNDKFTGYGNMELQRRCDEIISNFKLNFKLNYDHNISKILNKNEISAFISRNEIWNKVKLQMKVISFGCFPPKNENFNILPF